MVKDTRRKWAYIKMWRHGNEKYEGNRPYETKWNTESIIGKSGSTTSGGVTLERTRELFTS